MLALARLLPIAALQRVTLRVLGQAAAAATETAASDCAILPGHAVLAGLAGIAKRVSGPLALRLRTGVGSGELRVRGAVPLLGKVLSNFDGLGVRGADEQRTGPTTADLVHDADGG